jgi:hypothetical protein
MTARRRLMERLLDEALDRGEVAVAGQQLVLTSSGQAVLPELRFETVGPMTAAGVRLGGSKDEQDKEQEHMAEFAERPEEPLLLPRDPRRAAMAERSRRAALRAAADRQAAVKRFRWPEKGFAKLPAERLFKKGE